MSKRIQLRRGTTAETNAFTGALGEVTVDTTKDVIVVHDGVTAGGFPNAARANTDGTISLIKKDGTSAGEVNSAGLFNDTLTSTNTNQALTAAQGKVLKDSLNTAITSSFGVGQTWQNLTSSRASGVTYTNTTGKPIAVSITLADQGGSNYLVYVNGVVVINIFDYGSAGAEDSFFIVPTGASYSISTGNIIRNWAELR